MALIGVPFGAAMSIPVCAELLILLLTPYLDVILPDIGIVANLIPFTSGMLSILSCSFCFSMLCVIFSCTSFFAISMLVVFTSSSFCVYFSIMLKSSSSSFSSLILFTTASASSIVFNDSIVSLFSAIS